MERELDIACAAYKKYETVKSDASFIYSKHFIEGAQWADEHPKSPWIKCEDRMPEEKKVEIPPSKMHPKGWTKMESEDVIILRDDGGGKGSVFIDHTVNGKWYFHYLANQVIYEKDPPEENIIAWMPIPKFNKE